MDYRHADNPHPFSKKSVRLTKAAKQLLEDAGATEIADDYIVIGNTDLRILLSCDAVKDLNAQARYDADLQKGGE